MLTNVFYSEKPYFHIWLLFHNHKHVQLFFHLQKAQLFPPHNKKHLITTFTSLILFLLSIAFCLNSNALPQIIHYIILNHLPTLPLTLVSCLFLPLSNSIKALFPFSTFLAILSSLISPSFYPVSPSSEPFCLSILLITTL